MKREKTYEYGYSANCADCGGRLYNPGYNRRSTFCCGKYRQWYDWIEKTTIWDDGRDERGRFHHPKKIIERYETIIDHGGR